jgi:hypothetical protein
MLILRHLDVVAEFHFRPAVGGRLVANPLVTVEGRASITAPSQQLPRRLMLQVTPSVALRGWTAPGLRSPSSHLFLSVPGCRSESAIEAWRAGFARVSATRRRCGPWRS